MKKSLVAFAVVSLISGCVGSERTGFIGECYGPIRFECTPFDSPSWCASVPGCTWMNAGSYCNGVPRACDAADSAAECASGNPECIWLDPPRCTTWSQCATVWLEEEGGCAESAGVTAYLGPDDEEVVVADHCP